jgi:biotin carboxylase
MKNVLVIAPTGREYRELPPIAEALGCRLIFDDFAGSYFDDQLAGDYQGIELEIVALIEETIRRHGAGLSGVTTGVGYPGMPVVGVIAERLGLPGPRADRVLLCLHKYYCRVAQRELTPYAAPPFQLVDPKRPDDLPRELNFPLFLKPVQSCFSINARRIEGPREFREKVASSLLPAGFLKPLNDMLAAYTDLELNASYLLAESLLGGVQVSLEGYVFGGRVRILGIVDSVMYPGTNSFKRFEYPSRLEPSVLRRMEETAARFIGGIGYDNALFNIEFMYTPETDEIWIIEVNPKIASQFTDLFEKVDGTSSYVPLLQIALGHEPDFRNGGGQFRCAASCVMRLFEDRRVLSVPSSEQVESLRRRFPDVRVEISARPGRLLSEVMQDGMSYRYAVVNLGANSWAELDEKFAECADALEFQFAAP